jgi:hypothetical protein
VTSLLWCSSKLTRPVSPSREWSCCRRFEDRSRCLSADSWGVETSSSSLFSWGRDWNWFESRSRVVSAGGRERDGSSSLEHPDREGGMSRCGQLGVLWGIVPELCGE